MKSAKSADFQGSGGKRNEVAERRRSAAVQGAARGRGPARPSAHCPLLTGGRPPTGVPASPRPLSLKNEALILKNQPIGPESEVPVPASQACPTPKTARFPGTSILSHAQNRQFPGHLNLVPRSKPPVSGPPPSCPTPKTAGFPGTSILSGAQNCQFPGHFCQNHGHTKLVPPANLPDSWALQACTPGMSARFTGTTSLHPRQICQIHGHYKLVTTACLPDSWAHQACPPGMSARFMGTTSLHPRHVCQIHGHTKLVPPASLPDSWALQACTPGMSARFTGTTSLHPRQICQIHEHYKLAPPANLPDSRALQACHPGKSARFTGTPRWVPARVCQTHGQVQPLRLCHHPRPAAPRFKKVASSFIEAESLPLWPRCRPQLQMAQRMTLTAVADFSDRDAGRGAALPQSTLRHPQPRLSPPFGRSLRSLVAHPCLTSPEAKAGPRDWGERGRSKPVLSTGFRWGRGGQSQVERQRAPSEGPAGAEGSGAALCSDRSFIGVTVRW
jgi:hypothetical protein